MNTINEQKYQEESRDARDSAFAQSVRKYLIQNNLFQPLTDGTREETPQERLTPLTPTPTPTSTPTPTDTSSNRSLTPSS